MIKFELRELTNQERKKLNQEKISNLIGTVFDGLGMLAFIVFILLIPLLIFNWYSPVSSQYQLIYCIIIIIIAAIYTPWLLFKMNKEVRNKNEKPLKEVKAEILSVKTNRAIKRKDPEDFGSGYYIDITNSNIKQTLFLWGTILGYNRIPQILNLKITRRNDTKEFMNFELFGNYFEPEKLLPPFSEEAWNSGNLPTDGEILDCSIDEIN